jgi:hypothetical protein
VRIPLSLDSTLDQVVDDPEAWTTVLQSVPAFAQHMETGVQRSGGAPLRQVIAHMPDADGLRAGIEAALAGLGRERVTV